MPRLERIRCRCGRWVVDVTRDSLDGMAWPERWRKAPTMNSGPNETWTLDSSNNTLRVRCPQCDAWTTVPPAL